jgi:hypothetical protein
MSDEKRQTRLLPFRLRRAGGRRGAARDAEDFGADAELTALLRTWEAPTPSHSDGARARLLADFRATARPAPLWRRAFAAQVRVPLPVAACAVLALLLSPLAFGARPWGPAAPTSPARVTPETVVRVVEVPVVQERVVTRTVYVEKKEPARGRGVSSRPGGGGRPATPETASAKRTDESEGDERTHAPADASAGYFSRVNMEDFQPSDEMKIRVVKRGGVDEK